MNKKTLLLVTILMLIGILVTGCQPAGKKPADDADAGGEGEVVTITIWDFGGSDFAWLDDIAIPEFEEKNPNIKINHVGVLEDELGLKIETSIAAEEVPDIAIFVPTRVKAAGHVLILDDYMARDGISRDDYCNLFQAADVSNYGPFDDNVTSLPVL